MVKQFNGNKFDSLGEMDNSLKETKYQSSLINRHNSYLLRKLNVYLKKNLPTKKTPGPDDSTDAYYQTFKEEIIQTEHKLFQNIEQGTCPN